jgi:hypothetical protein
MMGSTFKCAAALSLSLAWLGLSSRVLTKHDCEPEIEFISLQSSFRKSSINGAKSSKKVISRIVLLAVAAFGNELGRKINLIRGIPSRYLTLYQ